MLYLQDHERGLPIVPAIIPLSTNCSTPFDFSTLNKASLEASSYSFCPLATCSDGFVSGVKNGLRFKNLLFWAVPRVSAHRRISGALHPGVPYPTSGYSPRLRLGSPPIATAGCGEGCSTLGKM
jgi:hypothetical protein